MKHVACKLEQRQPLCVWELCSSPPAMLVLRVYSIWSCAEPYDADGRRFGQQAMLRETKTGDHPWRELQT